MSDTILQLDDVKVSYGKTQALRGVSLNVDEGEIVGVIGPNGAGKTTMLDSIAGYKEYSGSITYNGTETASTNSGKLVNDGLVYCTENRDLFPYFTVHENLQMGAQFRNDDGIQDSFDFVYDLFPRLDERRKQEAQTMSGGEQQMLALGRALMSDPDVLMLDEPTLGLAPVIIDDISEAIKRLQEEGLTILLVEQNSTFALRHAERLYLLEQGSVELSGSADEMRDNDYIRDAYVGIT